MSCRSMHVRAPMGNGQAANGHLPIMDAIVKGRVVDLIFSPMAHMHAAAGNGAAELQA